MRCFILKDTGNPLIWLWDAKAKEGWWVGADGRFTRSYCIPEDLVENRGYEEIHTWSPDLDLPEGL